MEYVKVQGNTVVKFPFTMGDLKAENPGTSFPPSLDDIDKLERYQVYPVTQNPDPVYDPATEQLIQGIPQKVSGKWEVQRVKQDLSQEEKDKKEKEKNKKEKKDGIEADAEFQALLAGTLTDIDTRIDAAVTDLDTAKEVIKTLARGMSVTADQYLQ